MRNLAKSLGRWGVAFTAVSAAGTVYVVGGALWIIHEALKERADDEY